MLCYGRLPESETEILNIYVTLYISFLGIYLPQAAASLAPSSSSLFPLLFPLPSLSSFLPIFISSCSIVLSIKQPPIWLQKPLFHQSIPPIKASSFISDSLSSQLTSFLHLLRPHLPQDGRATPCPQGHRSHPKSIGQGLRLLFFQFNYGWRIDLLSPY